MFKNGFCLIKVKTGKKPKNFNFSFFSFTNPLRKHISPKNHQIKKYKTAQNVGMWDKQSDFWLLGTLTTRFLRKTVILSQNTAFLLISALSEARDVTRFLLIFLLSPGQTIATFQRDVS